MPVTQYVWNPLTDAYLMETDGAGNPTAVYTQGNCTFKPLETRVECL